MANTFGQSKANEGDPQPERTSSTNETAEKYDSMSESTWRPTDSSLESPTDAAFDDSEAKKRDSNIETDSPGIDPGVGK